MGVFEKGLPLSICALEDNPEGEKFQSLLVDIDKQFIIIHTGESLKISAGKGVKVEFTIDNAMYSFDSSIQSIEGPKKVLLVKPKVIHKKKIRDSDRMDISLKLFFTLWTESGRFEAKTRDISEQGIRIVSAKKLRKGALISLNLYIKEPKIRIICQGTVAWCKNDGANEYLYESGFQFTTLSNDVRKKLAKYVERALEVHQAETTEWDESIYEKLDM